jgi:hypothetical protein
MSAQIIRLADRRPPPPPPVNPYAEAAAWWLAYWGEWCHAVSAMIRPPR